MTSEELNVEKKVKVVCAQLKVKVHTCWGSTLYHRDDLPFHHIARYGVTYPLCVPINRNKVTRLVKRDLSSFCSSRLPDVYTQFRKAVESQSSVRPVFPTPEHLKPIPPGLEAGAIPTAEDFKLTGRPTFLFIMTFRSQTFLFLLSITFILSAY